MRRVSGWGGYPVVECRVQRPESLKELQRMVAEDTEVTPAGLLRSYGDSALGPTVIDMTRMDRILSFDEKKGIIKAEAGVSLASLLDLVVPRGWFVNVTPGTKFVTLGGCVASNVHGKNHHRVGSFGNFVTALEIIAGDGSLIKCSRTERSDLFSATFGGMGLVGVVYAVELKLRRIRSEWIDATYRKTEDLDGTFAALSQMDRKHEYTVAWIDCLKSGRGLGRGIVMGGDHSRSRKAPPRRKARLNVPFPFPSWSLNRFTVKAFNTVYYNINRDGERMVHYEPFFYPLDAVENWNRIYGRRGFIQYQCVLPPEQSLEGMREILTLVASTGLASFLAVLKRFKDEEGILNFPQAGYTLALDIPASEKALALADRLDAIVQRRGGRLYLTKDARTSSKHIASTYRLAEWREAKRRHDPSGKFTSRQARRLKLS